MLNSNQADIFNYLFSLIDHSGNGIIEEADFVAVFGAAKRNVEAGRTTFVDNVARRCYLSLRLFSDTDKDKTVSRAEWDKWVEGFETTLAEKGEIEGNYKRFTDAVFASIALGEAEISKADYLNWFSSLRLNGHASLLFDAMDESNNGTLSKDEFYVHLTNLLNGEENAVSIFGALTSKS